MNPQTPEFVLIAGDNPQVGQQVGYPQNDQGSLKPMIIEYLHVMRRRKWWILGVLAGAVMLALVATLLMRPTFTAVAQIEVSRDLKNVTNVQGVDSEAAGRDLEFYQTQYSLLEARSLAERVVRRLKLDTNEGFWDAHGIDPDIFEEAGSPEIRTQSSRNGTRRQIAAIETLLEHVSIDPIRGSSLVNLRYSSYDPAMSAQIANAWVTEFIAQSIARKFDSTAEARTFLERRLAELRSKVEESERALVDYATSRNIVTIDSGGQSGAAGTAQIRERTLATGSLESLNEQLNAATGARIEAGAQAQPNGNARTNVTLSQLRGQRATAAAEYQRLMVQFEPGYPEAQGVKQQINELDRAIAAEENRISRGTREDYQAALARENQLRAKVAALSGEVLSQRRDAIQYNIFQREADTNRQLYDSLLQRYKEIGVAGVSANNIAVIDQADPPKERSSPNLLLNLVLALAAGSVAALATVFMLEQSREGLSDPTKVAELLGIPLLGSVPRVSNEVDIVAEVSDPKSDISEAYLTIRSSLAFATSHGVPNSLMVVSSQPAEGKSITAMSVATVLARVGKRVLLIDADLRNPAAHTYLGVTRDKGLTNYLAGDDDYAALIQTIRPNFSFLAAGPSVPSAAELLSGERMSLFIRQMETQYDHIVVDSAPIIGLADAPLISQTVEAVIFVIETGKVPVRGLAAALSRLRAANARIVGAIMTKFDEQSAGYGYGYGYTYSYGASKEDQDNG